MNHGDTLSYDITGPPYYWMCIIKLDRRLPSAIVILRSLFDSLEPLDKETTKRYIRRCM